MTHNPLTYQPRRIRPWILWGLVLLVIGSLGAVIAYQHVRQERARVDAEAEASAAIGTMPNGIRFEPLGAYGPPKKDENGTPPRREEPKTAQAQTAVMTTTRAPAQPVKRAKTIYLVNEHFGQSRQREGLHTLPAWNYLPCVLESVVKSEIPGHFTVRLTRPVFDATGQYILIPQGQRVGAMAETADLLFGNERIPTFALSVTLADGTPLELGRAPIMDAAGTNGLTGEVHRHIWRLVWTSVFSGGLQGGQQVLQMQLGQEGAGPMATGIAREGSSAAQQRLGRAQDTRPTIIARAGDLCAILMPEAKQLPAVAAVYGERR